MSRLARRAEAALALVTIDDRPSGIASVRRLLATRDRSICELQAMFSQLCETNRETHERGRQHIAQLEARDSEACAQIAHLEAKAAKAVADFEALEEEVRGFRSWRIIRLALAMVRLGRFLQGR
jgi:hypothetical protein